MISITVHHHNPHLAAIAANTCTSENNKETSSSSSSSSYSASASASTSTSSASSSPISPSLKSNIEVQYKARFFHENEHEHSKQTITLKQVSNQSSETSTDLNNNNFCRNNNNENSKSRLPEEICDDKRPINLHSRSISLVINPQQEQDYSLQRLTRRRSMPRLARRTRLRLASEATCAHLSKQQHQSAVDVEPSSESELTQSKLDLQPIETQPGELNLKQQHQQTEEKLRCSQTRKDDEKGLAPPAHSLEATAQADELKAQSFECLRQTGKFLREISDEFAKYRRRTI